MKPTRRGTRTHGVGFALAAAVTLATILAPGLAGQAIGGDDEPSGPPWRPTLGARAGLDYRNQVPAIGALLRLPVPGVPLMLTPGADLVFHDQGLTERQGTLDVTMTARGIHLGGGPVALNSVFSEETERETKLGYTVVIGLRGRAGRFGTDLEFRWVRVDDLGPRFISLAITWTPGAPSRPGGL